MKKMIRSGLYCLLCKHHRLAAKINAPRMKSTSYYGNLGLNWLGEWLYQIRYFVVFSVFPDKSLCVKITELAGSGLNSLTLQARGRKTCIKCANAGCTLGNS